ncbi:MAG: FHA domain-containing protein [Arenicella sp.]|nr:FHA domain-containing protein [Arenicella sp.]
MAYLKDFETNQVIYLRAYHSIGRRENEVSTCLEFDFVSNLHALIEWKATRWTIRDMSSNGTWLNGDRLETFTSHLLKQGDVIEVAGRNGIKFDFFDASSPVDMIYQVDQNLNVHQLLEDCLLPSSESPDIELYKCPERHEWFASHIDSGPSNEGEWGPFEHNSELMINNQPWRFFLGNEQTQTKVIESSQSDMSDIEFRFDISQDEESTSLTLIQGAAENDLYDRGHHYLLAHLLRHKHAQKVASQNSSEVGWISCEDLRNDMGVEERYLNIMIFRARKQIGEALRGYSGSRKLFERRRGAVRTGISKFSIYKGGRREI